MKKHLKETREHFKNLFNIVRDKKSIYEALCYDSEKTMERIRERMSRRKERLGGRKDRPWDIPYALGAFMMLEATSFCEEFYKELKYAIKNKTLNLKGYENSRYFP